MKVVAIHRVSGTQQEANLRAAHTLFVDAPVQQPTLAHRVL